MEITYLQFILFGLILLSSLLFIINILKSKDPGYDYDKIILELNKKKEQDLSTLEIGNKKIDLIESKILECKKTLHFKLFDK